MISITRMVLLNMAKSVNWRYSSQISQQNVSMINYEHFFRRVQKSVKAIEAINTYQLYEKHIVNSNQYLTLTLRILTRHLKIATKADLSVVDQFVQSKTGKLKQNLNQIDFREKNDLLIFLINYAQIHTGLISEGLKELAHRLLSDCIETIEESSQQQKLVFTKIVSTLIRPIYFYFNEFAEKYVQFILKMFKDHPKKLIHDHPIFLSSILIFKEAFSPSSIQIVKFVQQLAEFILSQGLIPTFEYNTLSALLNAFYQIKLQIKNLNIAVQYIDTLISTIQEYFLNTIFQMNGKDTEQCLPILLKYNSNAQFIKLYFSIIAYSINKQGETCLHPVFIVQNVSYLTQQQMGLIVNIRKDWQANFIKFLHHYFNTKNIFTRSLHEYLQKILKNRLLESQHHIDLLRFYSFEYKNCKGEVPQAKLLRKLFQIQYIGYLLEPYNVINSTKQLNNYLKRHYRLWKESGRQYANINYCLQILESKLPIKMIQQSKYIIFHKNEIFGFYEPDFIENFSIKLFFFQVKLFYLNAAQEHIPKLLEQLQINLQLTQQAKRCLIKELIGDAKLSASYLQIIIDYVISVYGAVQNVEIQIFSLLKERYSNDDEFSWYNLSFITFFYHKYLPNLYYKLFFLNFTAFLQFYAFDRHLANKYIFASLNNQSVSSHESNQIIYRMISYYNAHVIQEKQCMDLIKQIVNLKQFSKCNSLKESLNLFQFEKGLHQNLLIKEKTSFISDLKNQKNLQRNISKLQQFYKKIEEITRLMKNNIRNQTQLVLLQWKPNIKVPSNLISYNIGLNFIREMLIIHKLEVSKYPIFSSMCQNLIQYSFTSLSMSQQFSLFKFFIENNIYCKKIQNRLKDFLYCPLISPNDVVHLLSKCPSAKNQKDLLTFIQAFIYNQKSIIEPLSSLYLLVSQPSAQLNHFVKMFIKKSSTTLPLIFQLSQMNVDTLKITLKQHVQFKINNGKLQIIEIDKDLFKCTNLSIENFYDIITNKIVQGSGKIFIQRLIQKAYPSEIIVVKLQEQRKGGIKIFFKSKK